MRVTYTPADGPAHEWDYKPAKLLSAEAEAIERVTGWTYRVEFAEKLVKGSALALRALVWVLLKRETPTLKFADVSFAQDEADYDFDAEERADLRQQILDDDTLDPDLAAQALAELDAEDVVDDAAAVAAAEPDPKA